MPVATRRQLLDAIYRGKPFRESLRGLGLTPNQVWGLTKTDEEWSTALEAALTATRRDDLKQAPMLVMWPAASAVSAGRTSRFGWAGIGTEGGIVRARALPGGDDIRQRWVKAVDLQPARSE